MKSVRHLVVEHFSPAVRGRAPDEELADAFYALLWSIETHVSVDGWALLRVVRETPQTLDAVGLMTLMPSGAVPIAITVRARAGGFEWSVWIARLDAYWLALSSDKQWNSVYLYASTEADVPPWTWGARHQGSVEVKA